MPYKKWRGLSQNQLKLLAAISMTIDHVGFVLFPKVTLFRIIGRLAFPIFAFGIYEGAKYTRKPLRYLLRMLVLGILFAVVYYLYDGELYGSIFITFSLSIAILISMRYLKEGPRTPARLALGTAFFAVSVAVAAVLCHFFTVDYGFFGVLMPVFAALFDYGTERYFAKESVWRRVFPFVGFAIGAVFLSLDYGGIQYYCLLSLILLAAASGERGKWRLKYFFYLYYPIHLLVIEGIALLVSRS